MSLGPINFQPGEFAKIALAIFFAGYLAENRELIAEGTWKVGPLRLPEPRYLLPILLAWGVRRARDGRRAGPRLVAAVLRPVRRDAVGGDRAGQLPRDRRRAVRRRRLRRRGGCSATCRRASTSGSTRGPTASTTATRSCRRCTAWPTAASAAPGSASAAPAWCPAAQNDFIFTSIGEELGLFGAAAVLMAYLLIVGAGLRIAPAHRERVREAARRRPHDDHRRAGVHHRRRRHQARPADRHHAAVRQLRRLVAACPTTSCSRC